ncbi:hypothetical protein ABMA27_002955 [Loxostege sticticalis]|uniref:Uncharacterized protein n=1 Tax=Loxostege sticticalis TaxID=481309 RepID=A0ABR3HRJ1_LOXSC
MLLTFVGFKFKWKTILVIFYIIFSLNSLIFTCAGKKIRYISTEHPKVTYIDDKYFTFAHLTAERRGRGDPFYYVRLHVIVTMVLDQLLDVHFYFYEYLSNMYKRGFIEMHFNFCQLMDDKFFGAPMRQGNLTGSCPYPPGEYHFYDMFIDVGVIPRSFPFTKRRIYANITY